MNRRTARKHAFSLVYSIPFHPIADIEEIFERYVTEELPELNNETRSYLSRVYNGCVSKMENLDTRIEGLLTDWEIGRINKVDLAILRLSLYESEYDNLPLSVSINEAVELAKEYGDDSSPKFINGLLGKASKTADKATDKVAQVDKDA